MIEFERFKFLGPAFIAFEACMHIYLVVYLIAIKASIPAIGFTAFELTMFIYILVERRRNARKTTI